MTVTRSLEGHNAMTSSTGPQAKAPELPGRFDFQGQEVRWAAIGDGSGRPLVLVHGTPFSSAVWRRIAPLLARDRKVFYFDLLGYGQSEMREGQDVSLNIQGRMFAALLDHWNLRQPDVAAHDFGGATALRAHLLHGCDYNSLTLVDAVAISPWGSPFVQHVKAHEAAFSGLPPYIHAALLDAYIQGAAHRPLSRDVLDLYAKPWLSHAGQPAFYRQIGQMDRQFTDEIEPLLNRIRCPVTVLWGEDDRWLPLEQGRHLASRLPDPTFHTVADAGHLVQEDAPEAVVAHLMESRNALAT
jgi:pimeloyl-ACP methyl ester carboxylesterase